LTAVIQWPAKEGRIMTTGRPRDQGKEREWRRRIEEQQSGGLSVRAFCSRRGLAEHNFYQWRKLLSERDRESQSTSSANLFVPVEVAGGVVDSRIEIVLVGGQRVNVPTGFDIPTLAQVVAVLEGRSC
jgi:transposase-like protein